MLHTHIDRLCISGWVVCQDCSPGTPEEAPRDRSGPPRIGAARTRTDRAIRRTRNEPTRHVETTGTGFARVATDDNYRVKGTIRGSARMARY